MAIPSSGAFRVKYLSAQGCTPELYALPDDARATDAQAVFHEHVDKVGTFNSIVVVVRQGVVRREGVVMWIIGELKPISTGTASESLVDRVSALYDTPCNRSRVNHLLRLHRHSCYPHRFPS